MAEQVIESRDTQHEEVVIADFQRNEHVRIRVSIVRFVPYPPPAAPHRAYAHVAVQEFRAAGAVAAGRRAHVPGLDSFGRHWVPVWGRSLLRPSEIPRVTEAMRRAVEIARGRGWRIG